MAEVVLFRYGHHWSLVNFKFRCSRQARVPLTGSSFNNIPVSNVHDSGENRPCARPSLPLSGDLHAVDFSSIGYVLGRTFAVGSLYHCLFLTFFKKRRLIQHIDVEVKCVTRRNIFEWIQCMMQHWDSYWDISDRPLQCKTVRKYNISWPRMRLLQLSICFNSSQ